MQHGEGVTTQPAVFTAVGMLLSHAAGNATPDLVYSVIGGGIMAAGHEGDGIALSPITGKLIAQLLVDGRSDIPLDVFGLDRFSGEGRNE